MTAQVLTPEASFHTARTIAAQHSTDSAGAGSSPRFPEPHLSYSQAKAFTNCPLQWRLSREYPPTFVPASRVFGGGVHAAVEAFHRARRVGAEATMDHLLDAYDRHWERETSAKGLPVRFTAKLEDAAGMRELAGRMLGAFVAATRPGEVVAVEEPFVVELAPGLPPVVGRIDLVEIRTTHDGVRRLHLVDFKTAARRPAAEDLDNNQLVLYMLAAQQKGWEESLGLPLAMEFRCITKAKQPEVVTVPVTATPRDAARFVATMRQRHQAMRSGACYPAPSWTCSACGHASLCRAWPNLPAVAGAYRRNMPAA